MIIEKILNNNVVIIKNEQGLDEVVCGRGIAFKKRVGDEIDAQAINQVFVLKDTLQNQHFQEIVTEIPLEYIQIADEIINMIKIDLGKKVNDSIYITLSDHLYMAIERKKEGLSLTNTLLFEIQHFYDTEYQLGLKAINIIMERLGIELSLDEAAFIAIHIVNAEMESSEIEQTMQITKLIKEICNIVRFYFSIEFDTESVYYYRFITHLRFFAQRLIFKKPYEGMGELELFEFVKQKYQTSFNCVNKISEHISKMYDYSLSNEEKLYLTIHIERVIYKKKG